MWAGYVNHRLGRHCIAELGFSPAYILLQNIRCVFTLRSVVVRFTGDVVLNPVYIFEI